MSKLHYVRAIRLIETWQKEGKIDKIDGSIGEHLAKLYDAPNMAYLMRESSRGMFATLLGAHGYTIYKAMIARGKNE